MPLRAVVCCTLLFIIGLPATAQLQLQPYTELGYAWGGIDALGGRVATAAAVVGRTGLALRYRRAAWALEGSLGAKWLFPRGRFDGAPYRGRALRLSAPMGLGRRLRGGSWMAAGYEAQNERDLDELERRATYVWRHNAWLRWELPRGRWLLGMTAYRALSNNPPTFYLADPRWSAALRIGYQLGGKDE